ncbi:hypothetical protein OROHE_024842 [Orobanche hederae]
MLLNVLDDGLSNVFNINESAKEIWDALELKYRVNPAGTKKFVVTRLTEFQMVYTQFVELNKFLLKRGRGFLVPDEAYEDEKRGLPVDVRFFHVNMFNSFDTSKQASKQGRVTLDFNQFIYCSFKLQNLMRRAPQS